MMRPFSAHIAALLTMIVLTSSLAGCIFSEEEPEIDSSVEAIFDWTPKTSIQAGRTTVTFNGDASLPQDGSLTYRWDFDGNGKSDASGVSAENIYAEEGTYEVTLTVSDGYNEDSSTKEIIVIPKDAVMPIADAGSLTPDADCDGDEAPDGNFYLIYICEDDKDAGDRTTKVETTVTLDGSASDSGSTNHYITDWYWDLNVNVDSDGNGIEDDDNDCEQQGCGETFEWKDIPIGEREISLTVCNNEGGCSSEEVWVYVHYKGEWEDLHVNGNQTDGGELSFESTFVYDRESNNRIKRVNVLLVYPTEDDDWVAGNPNHELNIYMYNESDEEVINTTSMERGQGCSTDEDHQCVSLEITQYVIDTYEDGDWQIKIVNANAYDADGVAFSIELQYK